MKIELLGFMRCGFSGFGLYLGTKDMECGPSATYRPHYLVLSWWVYMWRTWQFDTDTQQDHHDDT